MTTKRHQGTPNTFDQFIRAYLKAHTENQGALAAAVGRDRSWLNRYINGTGTASIDDVLLLLAAVTQAQSGRPEAPALSVLEQRLLRAFRALPDDQLREDVVVSTEAVQKARRQPHRSTGPSDPASPTAALGRPATRRADERSVRPGVE